MGNFERKSGLDHVIVLATKARLIYNFSDFTTRDNIGNQRLRIDYEFLIRYSYTREELINISYDYANQGGCHNYGEIKNDWDLLRLAPYKFNAP